MHYPMLCTSASVLEIGLPGQISAGFTSGKPQNWPSGRPKAGRRTGFEVSPTRIRPKSYLEAQFPSRKHYCVTYGTDPRMPTMTPMCTMVHTARTGLDECPTT